jgi:peptidoglycan/LPS O-acetylase OafA/YrhL
MTRSEQITLKTADVNVNKGNVSKYMPQLDSLRTFAVFLVLLEHWLYQASWTKLFPLGMTGVTLFFVLSGFLITQILLNSRIISERKDENKFHSIKQFYIRRTLRIFPIYYITIFVLFLLNIQNIREKFLWFLFYASNIYFYKINDWAGNISHLWTLAVEEQFYIFWPFLILFIPKRFLLKGIIAITILGPVIRTVLYLLGDRSEWALSFIFILTPSCMDCFGLGALIAYWSLMDDDPFLKRPILAYAFLIINIGVIVILSFFGESALSVFLYRFSISAICMMIISKASKGFKGITGSILENPVLRYLGKVSYGLYLYHNFIPMIYASLGLPVISNIYFNFVVQLMMLVILCTLSWYLIENPVNNLKKKFSYN